LAKVISTRLPVPILHRLFVLLAACPSAAGAQQVRGVVHDASNGEPVFRAFVALIDTASNVVIGVTSDSRGRYTIPVREAGIYAVVGTREGYARQVSNWFEITGRETVEVTVRLARLISTLSPVIIEAQRDSIRALSMLGLSVKSLGGTIITPAEVDAASLKSSTMSDLIGTLHLPTLRVKYMHFEADRGILAGWYTCIVYTRTGRCVTVVIDGVRHTDLADLVQLDNLVAGAHVAYMVFLQPQEAGVLYGTSSDTGVLLIVTKGAR
jgi:carboxypeptidase family protein